VSGSAEGEDCIEIVPERQGLNSMNNLSTCVYFYKYIYLSKHVGLYFKSFSADNFDVKINKQTRRSLLLTNFTCTKIG